MRLYVGLVTFFLVGFAASPISGHALPFGLLPFDDDLDLSELSVLEDLWKDVNGTEIELALHIDHPYTKRETLEVVELYGYKTETHTVESDGYFLSMHRITGNKTHPSPDGKPAVLLLHGMLCSSMDWVMAGPERSLGFLLADAGYDIWMGNFRGNKYSRKHKNPEISKKEYFDFSWHEMGVKDVPAMIDYILEKTENKKIFTIGHSQGTTALFVMASERPEYNDKIEAMFTLAPVTFSKNLVSPVLRWFARNIKTVKLITDFIEMYEYAESHKLFGKSPEKICDKKAIPPVVCMNILFYFVGFNKEQFDMDLLPVILSHVPAGGSLYQLYHYAQLIESGYFRQFDHGLLGNFLKYKKFTPPSYKLENVTAPVYLYYSNNDWLSHPEDVKTLHSRLPNVRKFTLVPNEKFNHLDFIWAKDVKTLINQEVMSLMAVHRSGL